VDYLEKDIAFIESNSIIISLDKKTATDAGRIKHKMRELQKNNFGLADAIILATAGYLEAKVLTGDYHFRGLKNTEYLE
jgi:predicted nucleic acid-binding protein